ncbi:hypothetical protein [Naumannella halotolerans]|uniref:Scaffolding protein n=1 Tax=Naumannella halotolerans TaxID=993414 RepID=A0A4R7J3C0_9ACTN|nr:hypothetical protein [Naumannella halotolerans]TDT30887.1 hypothetical protein CLV29_2294 [Naumannella halotolerans]
MTDNTTNELDTTPDTDGQEPASKKDRQEAKYRAQLRDTEAERDRLAARLETMQRNQVEQIAADTLATPAGLWASGVTLDDLTDTDGDIDRAKVDTAVKAAAETLGLRTKPAGNYSPLEGLTPEKPKLNDFSNAFAPQS